MKTKISQFKIQTLQKKRTSGQINQVQIQVFAAQSKILMHIGWFVADKHIAV